MSWTFVDSLNKLSSLLGDSNSTSDDMFPLAIRKKELNRGETQLAFDAKCLLGYQSGTVDSNLVITMPADWFEIYTLIINDVVITNDREIALADWYQYTTWSGADPYYYFWPDAAGLFNLNLIGGNAAGKLYKLFYFKTPTLELSANDDVSIHNIAFREIPAYYAASELMRQIGNNARADEYRAIYEAGVIKADNWARKLYINKQYARPDFGNNGDFSSRDIQGRGYVG